MKKVTIIGAGFSGLTSAFYLVRAGYSVEIFESSSRAGGLIDTLKTPYGPVETAANGLLNSALVEDLFEALDLPLIGTRREARRRYIFRGGRVRRWPLSLRASLRVVKFVFMLLFSRRSLLPREQETMKTWGERVLGVEAGTYLVNTALQGIYAGDPSRMSARLIVGRLLVRKHPLRKPRRRGTVAPPEGMGQLVKALEAYLRKQGVVFYLGSNTKPSARNPVIVATSASAAADFVDAERARLLREVELSPIVTTTAFFKQTDDRSRGFGVLFPPGESSFLGVLKNTFIFENRGSFSETWIRGGALSAVDDRLLGLSDSQIVTDLTRERQRVFGLSESPSEAVVTRWPQAIPHYTLELERRLSVLDRAVDNVFLMGNYLGDLGLAKILERASRWPERLKKEGQWT